MKKFKRFFTYCAIGTAVLASSCVSEDISPEVEDLRRAQTDYLQAQAALEQAKAATEAAQASLLQTQAQIAQAESDARVAMMAAETALMEAQAAYEEALMDARMASEIAQLEAEVAQAQYERDLLEAQLAAEKAELENRIAQAEVDAAQAQIALQEAIDELAGQINETAQEYLSLYQNTTEQANNKLDQINSLMNVVARYEANLDAEGNVIDFDQVALDLEATIAADMAEISALQDAISRLEGLNANTAGVEEEVALISEQIDELDAGRAEARLAVDLAANDFAPFDQVSSVVANVPNTINILENNISVYENWLSSYSSEVDQITERLEPYMTDLDEAIIQLNSEFETLRGYLETVEEEYYEYQYVSLNGTTEQITEAEDEYNAAIQQVQDYTGTFIGPASRATDQLNSYYFASTPGTVFGDAVSAYSEIVNYSTYQELKSELSNTINNLNNTANALSNAQWQLENAKTALEEALASVGVETAEEFWVARSAVYENYISKVEALNEIQAEITVLVDLRDDLLRYLTSWEVTNFNNQIASYQAQIASLEADIEMNQDLLVQNAFEAEEMAAMISRTEEKIDRLMEEYNALVALADEYLEMFYDIVDNN